METSLIFVCLTIGIIFLYLGAETLVLNASKLAISFGMTTLMAGLTIVAFCTSMPELVSSLVAQISEGDSNMALGNVVGSNIANVGLILGALALVRPIPINENIRKFEAPIGIALALGLWAVMLSGKVSRSVGVVLLALLVLYVGQHIHKARVLKKSEEGKKIQISLKKKLLYIFLVLLGAAFTVTGGYIFVKGAVSFADKFNLSGRLVGLTIVAVGSSLPEFAASFVSLVRKNPDIAVGNVFGSNILNILLVLGVVALLAPLTFSRKFLFQDMPFMLGFSLLAWIMTCFSHKLNRISGAVLLLGYGCYIYVIA
ncbi:MAG: Inner membrane protein YrbG [Chlamydiae bacterium]|nr:Inner membrane protein YrbG [Chlamydiota bacterium]